VAPDRVGEDPKVVPHAFRDDVDVPPGFFKLAGGSARPTGW